MKVNQEWRLKDQKNKMLGIEIEMEGHNLMPNDGIKYWDMKGDGSLRGNAMEYVLRTPCLRGQYKQRLETLKKALQDNGAVLNPSERCGVHIHINCQQLWHTQVLNFIICYIILEELMTNYCGQHRTGNLYCLRGEDAEYLIYNLALAAKDNTFRHMMDNAFRYSGINVTSLKKFGSIEFRTLGTPNDIMDVGIWIEMLLAIFDFSHTFKTPIDIIESVSAGGAVEFLNHALGDHVQQIHHPNVERSIMSGIRRVQDIAYSYKQEDQKYELPRPEGVVIPRRKKRAREDIVIDDVVDDLEEVFHNLVKEPRIIDIRVMKVWYWDAVDRELTPLTKPVSIGEDV